LGPIHHSLTKHDETEQQAQDRAAIWALTQQASTPETCAVITANETPCFGTFQTGSN